MSKERTLMKISISFKNNENEKELYEYIISKYSASAYIKELVSNDMKLNKKGTRKRSLSKNDDMNFNYEE